MFSRGKPGQRYRNLINERIHRAARSPPCSRIDLPVRKSLPPTLAAELPWRSLEPKRRSRVDVAGWRARGRALMRIGPVFPAVVAIALIAAAGVHDDGLAERTARPAQPRQLAQTPERAPPPTGQVGPENPTAPAPPAAAPSANPPAGTPATVLDDQEVSTILGKSVRSSADEDMGRIVDI